MVVKEPEYDVYNLYPIEINKTYCGGEECEDEKEIFSTLRYYGRISYCNIIFNLDILSQDQQDENCLICNKDTDKTCALCKYLYKEENGKKICLYENEISQIEITTLLTTSKSDEQDKNNENNCTNEELINNNCLNEKITINQILQIKQNLIKNYTYENTIIKTENIIIKNSDNSEISNIDLGDYETILKTTNDIPNNYSLIFNSQNSFC